MRFILILFFVVQSCSPSSSGLSPDSEVYLTIQSNQTISGFNHRIDYYAPSNATSAIVFLHGGGGKKEGAAYNLGIKNDDGSSNYDVSSSGRSWLLSNKVALIFPQGQMPAGSALSWTWNNYVMDSGQDDIAFLQALELSLRASPLLSKVNKIYLVGHSNGGMMSNRMWCESPNTFAGYAALAGPPAAALAQNGSHPCNPSVIKPYMGVVGDADSQLQTSGQMNALTWTCSNYNSSNPAWVSGTVINEKNRHTWRTNAKCSSAVNTPTVSGQLTTYLDCSGSLKLVIVSQSSGQGGDHCLRTVNGGCLTTLAGPTGFDYKTEIFNFLKQF